MRDDELQTYSLAYQKLILKGLGDKCARQAGGFELVERIRRRELVGTKDLCSVKRQLSKALVCMSRQKEFRFSGPYLTVWLQKIIAAESMRGLGLVCVHLSEVLFGIAPE